MVKQDMTIDPRELFSAEILDYEVETTRRGRTRYVNLDNAATTPPLRAVEEDVQRFLMAYGSVHRGAGTKSKVSTDSYERSRETIKQFVGAPSDAYVVFSGNTTGGVNTAAYYFSFLEGKVAVSTHEHSSSWLPWVKAEGTKLLGVQQVSLDAMAEVNEEIQRLGGEQIVQYGLNADDEYDLNEIEALLRDHKIKVLVLTAASNLTCYCPDIAAIGKLVHRYGAYLLVDGCQFIQHHPVDMQAMGIDFLVASGHKFYAPYGGGFLIGPKAFLDEFLPYQIGGGNLPYITGEGRFLRYKNQLAHDPGTPNAVGAVAMASALTTLKQIGLHNIEAYERGLAQRLFEYLHNNPKFDLYVPARHLTTVLPFNLRGRAAVGVAEDLNALYGIGVRAGSFCMYEAVRQLLGITDERETIASVMAGDTSCVPGLLRASIGLCSTADDINRAIEALEAISGK